MKNSLWVIAEDKEQENGIFSRKEGEGEGGKKGLTVNLES